MIVDLAQSAIKDICIFLRNTPDFFSSPEKEKKLHAEKNFKEYPSFISYLTSVNEQVFMIDMKEFISQLKNPVRGVEDKNLLHAFCSFLVRDFPDIVEFEIKLQQDTHLGKNIAEFILLRSEKEISQAVAKFIGQYMKVPYIVVQSPVHISSEDKKDIRENMLSKYTYAFPSFIVNPKLIGGMRILVDGQTEDKSWYGRVMNLSHLLHK